MLRMPITSKERTTKREDGTPLFSLVYQAKRHEDQKLLEAIECISRDNFNAPISQIIKAALVEFVRGRGYLKDDK